MSKINMVDLAGSERASQTGATGVRFEESKHINQSLMSLGVVIKNLCALAAGRSDQGPTPYRDSKLTMLLKDAVGGNCKTVMIATISPADQDYEQTLSTLRYANRVKSIRNKVMANVTKTDEFIKELLEEKEALLAKLNDRRKSSIGYSEEG
ncbi:osmotic avoidance abnormal protein 3-like [Mercenaria mercenaria]|uniref:osmotic avoidance abnormal protein 3-like n=1 Tax=Mercenaria mercenaria TaxID=6596 RepID=UPI00234E46A5|nr:osmotic avoidance abnormal protein 3-like [Mercenaria mercenaria]